MPLRARDARAAVAQLAAALTAAGAVARPELLAPLLEGARIRDLIHVGDAVLLPHFRTDAVERIALALGIAPEPVAEPGERTEHATARVVALVLAPAGAARIYLQTVAALASILRADETVARLIAARSAAEVCSLPEIAGVTIRPRLTVRDVMTPRVYRVEPHDPVRVAVDLLARHGLRALPVVGEGREVLGMVSDRDLLRALLPAVMRDDAAPASLEQGRVRDVMTRSVICVSEEQALAEVASLMVGKDLERLPVTYEGKLTGFLTRGDILRKLFG